MRPDRDAECSKNNDCNQACSPQVGMLGDNDDTCYLGGCNRVADSSAVSYRIDSRPVGHNGHGATRRYAADNRLVQFKTIHRAGGEQDELHVLKQAEALHGGLLTRS